MPSSLKSFEVLLLGADGREVRTLIDARWWPEAKEAAEKLNPGFKAVSAEEIPSSPPEPPSRISRILRATWIGVRILAVFAFLTILAIFISEYQARLPKKSISGWDYRVMREVFQGAPPDSFTIIRALRYPGMLQAEPRSYYEITMSAADLASAIQNVHVTEHDRPGLPHWLGELGATGDSAPNAAGGGLPGFILSRSYTASEWKGFEKMISEYRRQGFNEKQLRDIREAHSTPLAVRLGSVYVDASTSPSLRLFVETMFFPPHDGPPN